MNLDEFLQSQFRNQWINEPGLELYVRKSIKYPNCLEIASVTAVPTGAGAFRAFLDRLEQQSMSIYIENVLTARVATFLANRGYKCTEDQSIGDTHLSCWLKEGTN